MAEQGQEPGGSKPNPSDGDKTPTEQKIVIGEGEDAQEYTAEQVAELVQNQATATQKSQESAALLQAAEKYGIDPKVYVEQAEGSFARMAELIQDGVIDEQGQVIKVVEPKIPKPGVPPIETRPSETNALEIVARALKALEGRVDTMADDQTSMIRMDIDKELRKKYQEFDGDDVSRLFGQAKVDSDQGKQISIWERAKELSKRKLGSVAELRKVHAKEFKIDLEKWDERNALKEQGAKGGVAPFLVGKKVVFNPKGKDEISPAQADQARQEYEAGG
ncbi:hypothetical protein LCGC14_2477860 [marine sediment metagenome]|uniref:Uncharacterized protein n=1 Tax=marine sediment metagenome TaxID=412755 RepID=A0A0F9B8H1_9ZZZZ